MQKVNLKTKNISKTIMPILLIIFSILIMVCYFYTKNHKIIQINGQKFFVELAKTSEKQMRGLGGRVKIGEKEGMLFDFSKYGEYSFWMKDMKFDLDIFWINEGKIVYIAKNVSHESLETINPQIMADKVLEINSGLTDRYNFKIGDSVKIY
ncbi:MAG: DUF192 domain-containing protein [bacterium]|nr:DUF192 domain-containing protein [bacterium]